MVQEIKPLIESRCLRIEDIPPKLSFVGLAGGVFDEEGVFLEEEKIKLVEL